MASISTTTTITCRGGKTAAADIQLHSEKPEENKKAIWDFIWSHQLDRPELVHAMLVEVAHVSHQYPGVLEELGKNLSRFQEPKSFPADIQFVNRVLSVFTVTVAMKWVMITPEEDSPQFILVDDNGLELPTALECSICLNPIQQEDKAIRFPCHSTVHIFHSGCLFEWLTQKNHCPLCRNYVYCIDKETNRLLEALKLVTQYIKQQQFYKLKIL